MSEEIVQKIIGFMKESYDVTDKTEIQILELVLEIISDDDLLYTTTKYGKHEYNKSEECNCYSCLYYRDKKAWGEKYLSKRLREHLGDK